MLRALALRYLLSERHVVGFIERLERSPELRDASGFGDALPSNSAFSRFFRLLSERADLPEQPIAGVVDELKKRLPDMGREVAVDSTDIESCANPRRTRVRDPDAERGVRTRKIKTKGERKTEPFFGCKMRSPADEALGVPPIREILPANKVDVNTLPALMETAGAAHDWFQPKYLMANKGCDSQANHRFVYGRVTAPIIHIRRPKSMDARSSLETNGARATAPSLTSGRIRMTTCGSSALSQDGARSGSGCTESGRQSTHVQQHEALARPEPASVPFDEEGGRARGAVHADISRHDAGMGGGGGGREDTPHGDSVRVSRALRLVREEAH